MDLMLPLIFLTLKISAFLVQISLRRPYAKGLLQYFRLTMEEKLTLNL